MKFNVISAIFRRNFYSYFSNPTGYVFICVFVLLNSFAAFWPHEFFNANLANLDQLNRYLPYILLVFIPAITMSIWAEERRQGTDELLLTIPAGDFDVVLGKYLAAVAIYTVALLFSLICNLAVLNFLGRPDVGLFLGTYVGYWMVGVAMLAVGMVASFLTGNLTVGFVLGALFNAPLAFAAKADVIFPAEMALAVKRWSLEEQFRDFGRGVVSLSSVAYFLLIVAVMLYLSMVLIGRRHWQGGRDGTSLGGHYLARTLALVLIAGGLIYVFDQYDLRADVTSERLSSLSPQTRKLIRELDAKRPVRIDAYISPDVPEAYVQTRLDLVSTLREFDSLGGNSVVLRIHDTLPLSREAEQAEQQYGITARAILSRSRGAISREQLYLGVAFASGLDKVVVPFFDRGIPVEYELVRSICTVAQQERKKIGVLATEAGLFGGFNPQTMSPMRNELLIDELEKQYEVVPVSSDAPIATDVDALLAVQPSSLSPEQMSHFIEAVRKGVPTAIFEDPFPAMAGNVTPTSAPKRPPQMNMFSGNQPPMPKGDIGRLWEMLGVDFMADKIVWQRFNPYPKLGGYVTDEWVFVNSSAGENEVFSQKQPISSKLQTLLFLFPGSISRLNASSLKFEPLVQTGDLTGTVRFDEILEPSMFGAGGGLNRHRRHIPSREIYVLAAHVHGKLDSENLPMSDALAQAPEERPPAGDDEANGDPETGAADDDALDGEAQDSDASEGDASENDASDGEGDAGEKPADRDVNVVLVADIDVLYSDFFRLRAQGDDPDQELSLNLDNVTFVLNTLDVLAGDQRFVEIRKRRPQHRTLERIEERTKEARQRAHEKTEMFRKDFDEARQKEEQKLQDEISRLQNLKNVDEITRLQRVAMAQQNGQRRLQAEVDRLEKRRDRDVSRIERELALEVNRVQDGYKMWAVVLPPIPPLLVGLAVFFNRRAREREGVSRARLR
ncbi:MAG: Gldg family protein [Pirellulales bacterium]